MFGSRLIYASGARIPGGAPGHTGTKERGLRDGVGAAYQTMESRGELVLSPGRISDVQTLLAEVWERWGKPKAIVTDRWRGAELRFAVPAIS